MSLLIKNGMIATASETFDGDIYIEGETIAAIGKNLAATHSGAGKAAKVIDAKGCYVFPGGIDAHTHMNLPFMGTNSSDDFETGTIAGLHGGTTTIIDFAFQAHGGTLDAAYNRWQEMAQGKAAGDYAFHMAVTDFNPKVAAEIKTMTDKHGITSFKIFMAYKGALMVDDRQIVDLMAEVKKHNGLVIAHCENGDMVDQMIADNRAKGNKHPKYHVLSRPPITEAEATGRLMDIAHAGQYPLYIVHMTCDEALDRVREGTRRQQKVYVETCIQYLVLDESLYFQDGFEGSKWVMSPPLRKKEDQEALWAGMNQNLVHTVATDHCPFCMDQKKMGIDDFSKIPNGMPGIEHRMELLFSEGVLKNKISMQKFVDVTSTAPARIFGLAPRKGTIAIGADADLVILDPKVQHTVSAKTHHMNCDYSAFEGWKLTGKIKTTVLRGTIAVDGGKALVGKGFGKYLPRKQSGALL
ncbi:MAG: dihydropyrimidinase [Bdellovibrionales bacterium]|nr:dihydropyrimidinase [Bdellovibrionales bacterium]